MRLALPFVLLATTVMPAIAKANTISTGTSAFMVTTPGSTTSAAAVTVTNPNSAWLASIPGAQWINSTGSGTDDAATGTYVYTFTFTVPKGTKDVFTGSFSSDNQATATLTNAAAATLDGSTPAPLFTVSNVFGTSTADYSFDTVTSLGTYTLAAGIYRLEFDVTNPSGAAPNPTGLLAQATLTPTPEPSSLMLLGTGLAGVAGFARRKFRS